MPVTRTNSKQRDNSTSEKATNTLASKRNRSPQPSDEKIAKKSRKVKLTSKEMEEFKQLLKEVTGTIEAKIENSNVLLSNKFDNLSTHVCNEVSALKSSVDNFKIEVSNELAVVNTTLFNHNLRIENNEDDIERLKRINDLRLTGILPTENENLYTIVEQFALAIGFQCFGQITTSVERIPIKDRITGKFVHSNTLMIHFALLRDKQMFYSHYLYKLPFNTENLNIPNNGKVILCENLTAKNRKIFGAAQSLRKEKKIAQVFTEDGIVKIRFNKGKEEPSYIIRNSTMLETLVAQQSLYQSSQSNAQRSTGETHTITSQAHAVNNPTPMNTAS